MFYSAGIKRYNIPGYHKADSQRIMGVIMRPGDWTANTVYYREDDDNYDTVIPSVFTGLYYKVKAPGKSGATEPTWGYIHGEETTDSTKGLIWEAVNYNLMPPSETISSIAITASHSITISTFSNTTTSFNFTTNKRNNNTKLRKVICNCS